MIMHFSARKTIVYLFVLICVFFFFLIFLSAFVANNDTNAVQQKSCVFSLSELKCFPLIYVIFSILPIVYEQSRQLN